MRGEISSSKLPVVSESINVRALTSSRLAWRMSILRRVLISKGSVISNRYSFEKKFAPSAFKQSCVPDAKEFVRNKQRSIP